MEEGWVKLGKRLYHLPLRDQERIQELPHRVEITMVGMGMGMSMEEVVVVVVMEEVDLLPLERWILNLEGRAQVECNLPYHLVNPSLPLIPTHHQCSRLLARVVITG